MQVAPSGFTTAAPSFSCYTWTKQDTNMFRQGTQQSVCNMYWKTFNNVMWPCYYTMGINTMFPGCGGCWCCSPNTPANAMLAISNTAGVIASPGLPGNIASWSMPFYASSINNVVLAMQVRACMGHIRTHTPIKKDHGAETCDMHMVPVCMMHYMHVCAMYGCVTNPISSPSQPTLYTDIPVLFVVSDVCLLYLYRYIPINICVYYVYVYTPMYLLIHTTTITNVPHIQGPPFLACCFLHKTLSRTSTSLIACGMHDKCMLPPCHMY